MIYYKAIVKFKMKGDQTLKNQLIGEVSAGGFSSKLVFMNIYLRKPQ